MNSSASHGNFAEALLMGLNLCEDRVRPSRLLPSFRLLSFSSLSSPLLALDFVFAYRR